MGDHQFFIENADGNRVLLTWFIVCPNPGCQKFQLSASLHEVGRDATTHLPMAGTLLKEWRLIPPSAAKVIPDYVPAAVRADYTEACLIRDLSPKASATLARRCLQGMIRDYWKVTGKRRLKDEIEAIKERVDPLTWKAIDAVRSIGNIGAHMEQDIDLIVEVDEGEAGQLIGLIEMLIKDWYVNRREREERLTAVVAVAEAKAVAKAGPGGETKTPRTPV